MYEISVAALAHSLGALSRILTKAETHCAAHKIDPSVLTASRLFPDMLPLTAQVMIACDNAKGCAARLAGVEIPSHPDTETTFPELQARIAKTQAFLATLSPDDLKGAETRMVTVRISGKDVGMSGAAYFARSAMPNFYFHMATAYNILRHNGVSIGKGDFLGR